MLIISRSGGSACGLLNPVACVLSSVAQVKHPKDLESALRNSWHCNQHSVVEVLIGRPDAEPREKGSGRAANVDFHGQIKVGDPKP